MFFFEKDHVHDVVWQEASFTAEECDSILKLKSENVKQASTGLHTNYDTTYRDSKIEWIFPDDSTIWLFEKIAPQINAVNESKYGFELYGLTEPLQLTEYIAPSGHYDYHIDKMFSSQIRKLSFIILLSDPKNYEGGELVAKLGKDELILPKTQGTIIYFPSYILHKVNPVTKGVRNSLVGWLGGPNFK
jgi:PKHD-type hydroxylase